MQSGQRDIRRENRPQANPERGAVQPTQFSEQPSRPESESNA